MGKREANSKSGFLVVAFAACAICFAAAMAVSVICLLAMEQVSSQMQSMLSVALNSEIDEVRAEDGFSGTLYNISDDLLRNRALVDLGQCEAVESGEKLQAAEEVLVDVIARTSAAGGNRYFYFARSNYLMAPGVSNENALGDAPQPLADMLADLRELGNRMVGSYENHIGSFEGEGYQLIVRTVAPDVYYVVDTKLFSPSTPPESFDGFNNVQMYYYDYFGNVVQTFGEANLSGAFTYDGLGEDDSGVAFCRQGGRNYEGVYCTSHSRNLRLAIVFDDDAANARELAVWAFGVSVVCVLAFAVAAFLSIRRAYRPFGDLAGRLAESSARSDIPRGDAPSIPRGLFRDDGAIIAQAVDSYENTVAEQQRLLSEAWICRLLSGDNPEVLNDYEDRWLGDICDPYVVAIIRPDSPTDARDARDAVVKVLSGAFNFRLVSMFGDAVAIVLLRGGDAGGLFAVLERLRGEDGNGGYSVYLSRAHADATGISSAYKEAAAVGNYFRAQGKYGVACAYDDVKELSDETNGLSSFIESLGKLSAYISALQTEEALRAFDEAAQFARAEDATDACGGQPAMLRMLCACCVQALEDAAASHKGATEGLRTELSKLWMAHKPAQVRKVVSYSLKRLVASEDELSSKEQFEALKAATQANFRDSNFSAGALARQFGVSQSWITRLFKKYNSSTFLEYVHGIRLNAAERLLADPSLAEAEIAGRVGYNNTVTMIRAFKKYRGVVPSQLRPGK